MQTLRKSVSFYIVVVVVVCQRCKLDSLLMSLHRLLAVYTLRTKRVRYANAAAVAS